MAQALAAGQRLTVDFDPGVSHELPGRRTSDADPYRGGDAFRSLYVVWLGSLKSTLSDDESRQQVTGFHMAGDMVGFEGVGSGRHSSEVVALEDSEVCVIPYARLEGLAADASVLRRHIHERMSLEIVRQHESMLMLGSMNGEERLATFLLDLSARFARRGYSNRQFVLRMSRAEIGSLLGLTLETVCRLLSQFSRDGLIEVRRAKTVTLIDSERLRRLASGRRGTAGPAEATAVRPARRPAPPAPRARPARTIIPLQLQAA